MNLLKSNLLITANVFHLQQSHKIKTGSRTYFHMGILCKIINKTLEQT